ncbi:MAG: hypothetical protein A2751_05035 [Candidatus Doudnabacteria bacterium RIFCSPHIGHO2_01_FULL_46_14]|uniref:HD domain-containing protein n=1 Tax=Candidatus Doudnabacteria bacterium RIFCSPHIGHO2_01_FULL_46_14 TaxID=1817824 RepID=A0A1F5NNS9_9BACT|nr:MAG: hypothetical protein A2751_05035 [Candidatus Doudnabacteria bacterium RIFCSPHIGHO2_01_FULL_46_14]
MKFTWPDKSLVSETAFAIVKKLRKAGYETYIAGGAVRDALLKRKINDIDIATAATPVQVKMLFAKTIPTGEKHGTMTVRLGRMGFEITTFRSESPYADSRRPRSVKFIASAEKDAKRRDFTLNALFYDPNTSEIIDFVDGITDLRRGRIRMVGNAEARLKEDALRLMRAVRLATVLNLEIERETRNAITKNAGRIKKISAERVKQELDKIILSGRPSAGVGLLDATRLLEYILPELKECQNITQPKKHHGEGDVYTHSLLALDEVNEDFDLTTRYAVLFHDLGKAKTREVKKGKTTFYNHPEVGADTVSKICRRLKFSKVEEDKIAWLVRYHMVPNDFVQMKLATRRKWALNPYFRDLLLVHWADAAASLGLDGRGDTNPTGYREGYKILKEIEKFPALAMPILSGNEVMKTLKIKPGVLVGKILKQLEEKKLAGKIKTKKSALRYLKKYKKSLLRTS